MMNTMTSTTSSMITAADSMVRASKFLALPFDIARQQYANAVKAGLIERSLLKSAKFGRQLNALEKLTLGPLARSY